MTILKALIMGYSQMILVYFKFTFTSPILPHSSSLRWLYSYLSSLNSANISSKGFRITNANVFNLPLCAIPKTKWSILSFPAISTNALRALIVASQPSIPNLFEVGNFYFKNSLNVSFSHK